MSRILRKTQRGSIAVLALWVLVLLSFLAIALSQGVRQKLGSAGHLRAREEIALASESVVKKIIADVQNSPAALSETATGQEWYLEAAGKNDRMSAGNAEVNFVVEDENSKINLNTASQYVLQNLFYHVARTGEDQAAALAHAVIDYRDSDDYVTGEEHDTGSENGVYRQAGLAYGPKNHEFEFIEELALIPGMTKEIYSFVESYITIYGAGPININTCDKVQLVAVGLGSELADKIIALRGDRVSGGAHAGRFVFTEVSKIEKAVNDAFKLSPQEAVDLNHAIIQGGFSVVSNAFKIVGKTRIPGTDYTGKFVCVYIARKGIQYWAQT